jgi:hypothetical protein
MTKFPEFVTRSELKRIVYAARVDGQRPGQSVCNRYMLDSPLDNFIWEMKDIDLVIAAIFNWYQEEYHA